MGARGRRIRRLAAALAGAVAVAWYQPVRRAEVVGSSMAPALLPGDRLVVVRLPWPPPFGPARAGGGGPGSPRPDRILIKRVRSVDRRAGTLVVEGDARQSSTDSRSFGPVSRSAIVGRALYRYAPAGRNGAVPGTAEYRSSVMTSHQDDLDRILTSTYLDDIGERSLADIRAMRTECQEAEVALSYLRRLIQGRLDIVHTYLEHPGSDALRDLGALVNDLPGILSSGPGRPAGPGHLPQLLSPNTEEADLTVELDAVLGADEISTLADLDIDQFEQPRRPARGHRDAGVGRPPGAPRADRHPPGRAGRAGTRRACPVDGLLSERGPRGEGAGPSAKGRSWSTSWAPSSGSSGRGPALAAPALRHGRHLQPLPQPDRAGPAPAVGGDPAADRQGPAHLGGVALRAGRDPRGARTRPPTWSPPSSPTAP